MRTPPRHVDAAMDHSLERFPEKHVRLSRLQLAGVIQPGAQLRRNGEIQRCHVALKLRQLRRSNHGGCDTRLCRHPIQGDLRGWATDLLCGYEERVQDTPVTLCKFFEDRITGIFDSLQAADTFRATRGALVAPRKKAARQRTPW